MKLTANDGRIVRRLVPGDFIKARELKTIKGTPIRVPSASGLTHLQFRRYAACPICNLHLRSFSMRHAELTSQRLTEVVVFPSPTLDMFQYQDELPFSAVADPERILFAEFFVGKSIRSVLDPRAWPAVLKGIVTGGIGLPSRKESPLGLPADFLMESTGRVVACHYGNHADDQWSIDEVIALANHIRQSCSQPSVPNNIRTATT